MWGGIGGEMWLEVKLGINTGKESTQACWEDG